MGEIRAFVYKENQKDLYLYGYHPLDFQGIYERLMKLTEGDHEIAQDGASWCELASVGEVYEFRDGCIIMHNFE